MNKDVLSRPDRAALEAAHLLDPPALRAPNPNPVTLMTKAAKRGLAMTLVCEAPDTWEAEVTTVAGTWGAEADNAGVAVAAALAEYARESKPKEESA